MLKRLGSGDKMKVFMGKLTRPWEAQHVEVKFTPKYSR